MAAAKVTKRSCASQLTRRGTFQEAALSRRLKRHVVIVAGVHLAISSNATSLDPPGAEVSNLIGFDKP